MHWSISLALADDLIVARVTAFPPGASYPERVQLLHQSYYRPMRVSSLCPPIPVLEAVIEGLKAQQRYTHHRSDVSPYGF